MSLITGIDVMRTPEAERISELAALDNEWIKKYNFDISICNWKNCWNISNAIYDIVNSRARFDDKNRLLLDINDIDKIIMFLETLSESIWEDFGGSTRTFEEIEIPLREDIARLQMLKRLMKEYHLVVYFYDLD